MKMTYKTTNVCAETIEIEVEGDTIKNVFFIGGCPGNAQGVARLVLGMKVSDAIEKLEGIVCGKRETSCPDQFAQALKELV